jgi:site-specific DNA-methyltransferase (adenine-specific)
MNLPIDKIIKGDCLAVLRSFPDNCVDVCFADPPFNLSKKYNAYKDRKELDDYLFWCEEWIREMVRVTKPTGSIFIHNIPKWLTHYATILNKMAFFRHWIAWDAMSAPLGRTLLPAHYGILFYTKAPKGFKFYEVRAPHKRCRLCGEFLKDYGGKKDQMHPFGNLVSDVWTDIHRIRHDVRRDEHPCQLPIHLLERVILMSTDAGDIVLDPFLGTGTTAIAAKTLGRHYIGIELDEVYVKIAQHKLELVTESKLDGFFVSRYLKKIQSIRDTDAKKLFPPQLTSQEKKLQRTQQQQTSAEQVVLLEKKPKYSPRKKVARAA